MSWCKCPGVPWGQAPGMAADKCITAYEKFFLANKDPAECKADLLLCVDHFLVVQGFTVTTSLDGMASWSYIQNIIELKEGIKTREV